MSLLFIIKIINNNMSLRTSTAGSSQSIIPTITAITKIQILLATLNVVSLLTIIGLLCLA